MTEIIVFPSFTYQYGINFKAIDPKNAYMFFQATLSLTI